MLQKTCSNEQVFSMPLGCFYTKTTCLPQKAMPYFRTFSSRLHNLFRQSDGVLPALFSSVKTVIPFANFGKIVDADWQSLHDRSPFRKIRSLLHSMRDILDKRKACSTRAGLLYANTALIRIRSLRAVCRCSRRARG